MAEARTDAKQTPRCSWCHKSQDDVAALIATPTDFPGPRAYICDECVTVCRSILDDRKAGADPLATKARSLPKPQDVKSPLDDLIIGQGQINEKIAFALYSHLAKRFGGASLANSAYDANPANTAREGAPQ